MNRSTQYKFLKCHMTKRSFKNDLCLYVKWYPLETWMYSRPKILTKGPVAHDCVEISLSLICSSTENNFLVVYKNHK